MKLCLDLKVEILIESKSLLIVFEGISFLESGLVLLWVVISDLCEHLFLDTFTVEFSDIL